MMSLYGVVVTQWLVRVGSLQSARQRGVRGTVRGVRGMRGMRGTQKIEKNFKKYI